MNKFFKEEHESIIRESIQISGLFLDVGMAEVRVTFPDPDGETDPLPAKVAWYAKAGNMANLDELIAISGRLYWPATPELPILRLSCKRSAAFAILTSTLQERPLVYDAIDVFAFRNPEEKFSFGPTTLLDFAYRRVVLRAAEDSVTMPTEEEYIHGKRMQMKPLAKIVSSVVESMERRNIDFILKIYNAMAEDLRKR